MPKPTTLTPDALKPAVLSPLGGMNPRSPSPTSGVGTPGRPRKITEAMQLRFPPEECLAIKVAATQRRMSHSDFMLACFHAYMEAEQ